MSVSFCRLSVNKLNVQILSETGLSQQQTNQRLTLRCPRNAGEGLLETSETVGIFHLNENLLTVWQQFPCNN